MPLEHECRDVEHTPRHTKSLPLYGEQKASNVGAPGFEPGTSSSRTKRATWLRHAPICYMLLYVGLYSRIRSFRRHSVAMAGHSAEFNMNPHAFSGGMRRRVTPCKTNLCASLGKALVHGIDLIGVLLFDDATFGFERRRKHPVFNGEGFGHKMKRSNLLVG